MSFSEIEGRPNVIEAGCDMVACDQVVPVSIEPGTIAPFNVKSQLEELGWSMGIINGTWPGMVKCAKHNIITVSFEVTAMQLSANRAAELRKAAGYIMAQAGFSYWGDGVPAEMHRQLMYLLQDAKMAQWLKEEPEVIEPLPERFDHASEEEIEAALDAGEQVRAEGNWGVKAPGQFGPWGSEGRQGN